MTEGQTIADVLEGRADWVVITGDCLAVLPTIPAGSVGAVVTDPPYGVGLAGKRTKRPGSLVNGGYSNLDDADDVITTVAVPAVIACIGIAGCVLVMPGIRHMWSYPEPADVGCVFNPSGAGLGRWGFVCFHPVLFYGRCPYLAAGMGHRPSGIHDIAAGDDVPGHPCPKPIRWMQWLIQKATTGPGPIVLDPFTGSGTTGVAAIKLGRRFIGIEIDPTYADIARRRIREAEPVLFTRGKSGQGEMFKA